MPPTHLVDRLFPDPATGLDLELAMADFVVPHGAAGRPFVGINMVTTVDGRAQRDGTAEGLAGRVDRRLMRLYRAAYDAVASGAGTLRATGLWLHLPDDLAERRARDGRPGQPTGVVIAGASLVPLDAAWFERDQPRILMVGAENPLDKSPRGTELLRAATAQPRPRWVLEQLAERGMGSLLLEGGPRINAAFLAAGLIDELCWTIGPRLLGGDGLPMIAPLPGAGHPPLEGRLVSVLRHGDELFLRYRFGEAASIGP